jgi:hypothetical protein
MPTHPNSRVIDRIPLDFRYLSGISGGQATVESVYNPASYENNAKPLDNLDPAALPVEVSSYAAKFGESESINDSTNPDSVLNRDPDLMSKTASKHVRIDRARELRLSLHHSGASLQNMVGYFFYDVGSSGEILILDNDDAKPDSELDYYYRPTVVFPYAHQESVGHRRLLKGNLPDGRFSGIYVGLFLVVNGWYTIQNGGQIDGQNRLVHNLNALNDQYLSSFDFVNDRVYCLMKRHHVDHQRYVSFFFEDSTDSLYDLDYNDCVAVLEYQDRDLRMADTSDALIDSARQVLFLDGDGLYLERAGVATASYRFAWSLSFGDTAKRDEVDAELAALTWNGLVAQTRIDQLDLELVFEFDSSDMTLVDGNQRIYLLARVDNPGNGYRALAKFRRRMEREQHRLSTVADPDTNLLTSDQTESLAAIVGAQVYRCWGNGYLPHLNQQLTLESGLTHRFYSKLDANGTGLVVNLRFDSRPESYETAVDQENDQEGGVLDAVTFLVVTGGAVSGKLSVAMETLDLLTVSDQLTVDGAIDGARFSQSDNLSFANGDSTLLEQAQSIFTVSEKTTTKNALVEHPVDSTSQLVYRLVRFEDLPVRAYCVLYRGRTDVTGMLVIDEGVPEWNPGLFQTDGLVYDGNSPPIADLLG